MYCTINFIRISIRNFKWWHHRVIFLWRIQNKIFQIWISLKHWKFQTSWIYNQNFNNCKHLNQAITHGWRNKKWLIQISFLNVILVGKKTQTSNCKTPLQCKFSFLRFTINKSRNKCVNYIIDTTKKYSTNMFTSSCI